MAPIDKGNGLQPKSSHTSDPALYLFIAPNFNAFDYLNSTLPSLEPGSRQLHTSNASRLAILSELSEQTQAILSQLNAQSTRLSTTLTQLTDDILRSGSRLGYEVDVLRGETVTLAEALSENLQDDVKKFVPGGIHPSSIQTGSVELGDAKILPESAKQLIDGNSPIQEASSGLLFIDQLRTLNVVRSRLESVIHVFGEAMDWTLPPSEVSVASSFISVSAPEPGQENESIEEKGQEVAKRFRTEIENLLDNEPGGREGVEAASKRVEALRNLATVWKGTAEEKARNKFVDGLEKLVEDRRTNLMATKPDLGTRGNSQSNQNRRSSSLPRGIRQADQGRDERSSNEGGLGFMRNLQRLREEIYLD
ncbi:MAG: hypothetical protein M1834_007160 [Cirrosporium novae-zelandiae]|nr:MAG: hypothetical protein M1834_007160 [Cirrosporium novae-zelandiae]